MLSDVDNTSTRRETSMSTCQSTAWTDDTQLNTSLKCGKSVTGVRSSKSVSRLKNELTPSVSKDSDNKKQTDVTGFKQSAHSPAGSSSRPAVVDRRSTKTNVGGAVKQAESGRSWQRPVTVHVELLSNWGHAQLVGLTEIELLDASECRIDVQPSADVSVSAASTVSQIDVLFNGKCKV